MKWTIASLALAGSVPAMAAASPNFFGSYEECMADLAYQMSVDPKMTQLECVRHGKNWVIIFDRRYTRNAPG